MNVKAGIFEEFTKLPIVVERAFQQKCKLWGELTY